MPIMPSFTFSRSRDPGGATGLTLLGAGRAAVSRVAWVIDPEAFTRFSVRQAPTFVLTLNDAANDMQGNCRAGCATPASFVSVAGDVSLDYALETIQRRQPEAAPRAAPLLKLLRASPAS